METSTNLFLRDITLFVVLFCFFLNKHFPSLAIQLKYDAETNCKNRPDFPNQILNYFLK